MFLVCPGFGTKEKHNVETEMVDYTKEAGRLGWRKEFGHWMKDGETKRYDTAKELYEAERQDKPAAADKPAAEIKDAPIKGRWPAK
jgi:hypothetical protein